MARRLKIKQVPAGVANGSPGQPKVDTGATGAIDVSELDEVEVLVKGITTGTVQAQRSLDGGTTWINEGSALTANGIITVGTGKHCTHVRGNITDATAVAILLEASGIVREGMA